MSDTDTIITFDALTDHHAIVVRWGADASKFAILNAFSKLERTLDRASHPTTVILDLSNEPHCPLITILNGVLLGPYYHHHLDEWLVFGDNRTAHTVGRILATNRRHGPAHSFDTEAVTLAYLRARSGQKHAFEAVDTAQASGL